MREGPTSGHHVDEQGRDDGYIAHRGNELRNVEAALRRPGSHYDRWSIATCKHVGPSPRGLRNLAKTGWGMIFAETLTPGSRRH